MLSARIGVAVTGVLVTGALATSQGVSQEQQIQDPRLKSGIELVSIDAQVVTGKGGLSSGSPPASLKSRSEASGAWWQRPSYSTR